MFLARNVSYLSFPPKSQWKSAATPDDFTHHGKTSRGYGEVYKYYPKIRDFKSPNPKIPYPKLQHPKIRDTKIRVAIPAVGKYGILGPSHAFSYQKGVDRRLE